MPSTTKARRQDEAVIRPVGEAPAVREAEAAMAAAAEQFTALDAQLQRYRSLVDPHVEPTTPPTLDELLEVRISIARVTAEHAAAERELRAATAAAEATREAERGRLRSIFIEQRRRLIGELAIPLQQAEAINTDLRRVEHAQRTLCGDWHLHGLAFAPVDEPTSSTSTALGDWKAAVLADPLFASALQPAEATAETTTD